MGQTVWRSFLPSIAPSACRSCSISVSRSRAARSPASLMTWKGPERYSVQPAAQSWAAAIGSNSHRGINSIVAPESLDHRARRGVRTPAPAVRPGTGVSTLRAVGSGKMVVQASACDPQSINRRPIETRNSLEHGIAEGYFRHQLIPAHLGQHRRDGRLPIAYVYDGSRP